FLEGEGCFYTKLKKVPAYPMITANQVNPEPIQRLHRLFAGNYRFVASRDPKHHDQVMWEVSGRRAAAVMMTLYTLLSAVRQRRIHEVLTGWRQPYRSRLRLRCLSKGHPLTGDNVYRWRTRQGEDIRRCLTCQRERGRVNARARRRRLREVR